VPALEGSVAELTWTVALAPGARLPYAQASVCDGAEPVIEHVPGPLYAGLTDQDTPVPPGNGSSSDAPVAVPVPEAELLLAVTVNPIDEPPLTVAASAVFVSDKDGAWAGITVKLPLLVAVPAGVVTLTVPLVAPAGTVAVTELADCTVNELAATPWNLTAVAPVNWLPTIVTDVPTGPLVGVKELIAGEGKAVTVKLPLLVAVPPCVVTLIAPLVAPAGTVACIELADLTANALAATPWNLTTVAPAKLLPEIVTDTPTGPLVGVNEVTFGGRITVKLALLVAVPAGVVTLILPLVAPTGTFVVIFELDTTVKPALAPLNLTALAPFKFTPVTVTFVPTLPFSGLNDEIFGAAVADANDPTAATRQTPTAASTATTDQTGRSRLRISQPYARQTVFPRA
jgi:hypothetical protein